LTWVFFRAETVSDAIYVITHLHTGLLDQVASLISQGVVNSKFRLAGQNTVRLATFIYPLLAYSLLSFCWKRQYFNSSNVYVRWSLYYFITMCIILLGIIDNSEYLYTNY